MPHLRRFSIIRRKHSPSLRPNFRGLPEYEYEYEHEQEHEYACPACQAIVPRCGTTVGARRREHEYEHHYECEHEYEYEYEHEHDWH